MATSKEMQDLVPSVLVRVNGSDFPQHAVWDLLGIVVQTDVEAPSMFTLRLSNWDMAKRAMTWSDDVLLAPGSAVEIQMGYMGKLETLIAGETTGLEPEFCAHEMPILTVRGYDRRHRLMRGRHTRSFRQMKDSDIARQVASDVGLTATVQDTGVTLDYVLQHNQTNLDFLLERARRIGYEVVVEDKTLLFRQPPYAGSAVLTLARDGDLLEFYPRLTTLSQAEQLVVQGWDFRQKAAVVGKAAPGSEAGTMAGARIGPAAVKAAFGASSWFCVTEPVSGQAEADQMAVGGFNTMALNYVTGDGVSVGRAAIRAGAVIQLDGLGQRFSGLYYVTSATHSYTPARGYRTSFSVRRNAT